MPTPVISAIVPVYNVAPYLSQCLDSLVGQSLQNIEIICVDDGSTDGSAEILDDYAKKDCRVKVIHQQNQGVSVARNAGISVAKGTYLSFVDGDDYLDCSAYEEILQNLGEAQPDIVLFRHMTFFNNEFREFKTFKNGRLITETSDFSFLVNKFAKVVWNRLYCREFLLKNNIYFLQGVPVGEDSLFNLACFAAHPTLKQIDKSFYFYRLQRQGAATFGRLDVKKAVLMQQALENASFYTELSVTDRLAADMVVAGIYHMCCEGDDVVDERTLQAISSYADTLKVRYSLKQLTTYKHCQKILYLIKNNGRNKDFISFTERLFSIKNSPDKKYKIIRFLGIKFQIKRHKKNSTLG